MQWSTTIDARTVRQQLRRAMRTATAPAPGPVQFAMPQSETTKEAAELAAEPPLLPNLLRPEPDRAALKPILDRLAAARRPVLLAGLGVLWDRASPALVALAEKLGAPVLVPPKCKGAIPGMRRESGGVKGCVSGDVWGVPVTFKKKTMHQ